MKFTGIALALASGASAQSLLEALASNSQFSALAGLLNQTGVQLPTFNGNVTLLAPDNSAISSIPNATLGALAANPAQLAGVLSYHILQGSYANITNASFIPTYLTPESGLANVTGGQRVHAVPGSNSTTFFSGLLQNSTTVNASIPFANGQIHAINRLLTPPSNVSTTAISLGLSSAAGALIAANLVETVDTTADLTLFVPNNAAFRRVASAIQNASVEELGAVLQYHVHPGLIYSTNITGNTTVPALAGGNLNIRVENGTVFVNNARVVRSDVLVANGVVHVIDAVLNPGNATATSSGNSTADAFSGASSASADVFTSGVPAASTTIDTSALPTGTSAPSSSSSGAAAKAIETGAVAMVALFGGVAAAFNM